MIDSKFFIWVFYSIAHYIDRNNKYRYHIILKHWTLISNQPSKSKIFTTPKLFSRNCWVIIPRITITIICSNCTDKTFISKIFVVADSFQILWLINHYNKYYTSIPSTNYIEWLEDTFLTKCVGTTGIKFWKKTW